ncbi:MAG TPA: DUF4145 domain-containing protein [Chthoniobacteraceae bacterium]|jgi:hypothetical protein|nr:DUF4145 domain-containing protein [Chthoniobacteraceae bacterium]
MNSEDYDYESRQRGKKLKVECPECGKQKNHVVLECVERRGREIVGSHDFDDIAVDWRVEHQIIQCGGCDTVSFRQVRWCSEYVQQISEDEWDSGEEVTLYPRRSSETRQEKSFYVLPHTVGRIYRETISCFNNGDFTLCAAGLRALIEGVCADRGVKDGPVTTPKGIRRKTTLEGKISGLREAGFISAGEEEALHEHRFLGNSAVHELHLPKLKELSVAIDLAEQFLSGAYDRPQMTKELKTSREKAAASKKKAQSRKQP